MADQTQIQVHHQALQRQHRQQPTTDATKTTLPGQGSSSATAPTSSQWLAMATLLPLAGILLTLSALTLTATVIGLAVAAPLFLIFSPVLVQAALAVALAGAGFSSSVAFGVTGLSAISWMVNSVRYRMADAMGYLG